MYVHVSSMQPLEHYRGFSSFKFVPETKDTIIVATKSEENRGKIETCILTRQHMCACMCVLVYWSGKLITGKRFLDVDVQFDCYHHPMISTILLILQLNYECFT